MTETQKQLGWQALIKTHVRRRYDYLASTGDFPPDGAARAERRGYTRRDLGTVPQTVTAAFSGSLNPLAGLDPGAVAIAVDLGCGAGLDAALLARDLA